jgi:hypothetical protein
MIVGDTLGFLLYGQKVIEINFCRNTSGTTKPSQLGFRAHPDEESTHRGKSQLKLNAGDSGESERTARQGQEISNYRESARKQGRAKQSDRRCSGLHNCETKWCPPFSQKSIMNVKDV